MLDKHVPLSPFPEELRSCEFWRAMLAELLGSLVFVSAVLGASVPGPGEASMGLLYLALAAGMVAVTLGHCFVEISWAQAGLVYFYLSKAGLAEGTGVCGGSLCGGLPGGWGSLPLP
ncbi:lens fiber major intrinsic protein-like [Oncorhynchus mykiss]|uniref:lens fiber major intrinsic protein-like n=1 Tax=Oncorhynchus mykiss TaxID=8022 RepID=UPI0018775AF7|nr:lens fiber major intrinsic protein-like [Oncorhynchus mykiss]